MRDECPEKGARTWQHRRNEAELPNQRLLVVIQYTTLLLFTWSAPLNSVPGQGLGCEGVAQLASLLAALKHPANYN